MRPIGLHDVLDHLDKLPDVPSQIAGISLVLVRQPSQRERRSS